MNQKDNNGSEKNLITLLRWYRLKRVNEFAAQCDEEQAWKTVQQRIRRRRQVRMRVYWGCVAAACLLVAVVCWQIPMADEPSLFDRRGEQRATLLTGESESYDLKPQNTGQELRYDTLPVARRGGAGKHTLNVPRGGEYKLVLADGTHVHANAESRITYPVAFEGATREVYLTGEAFFDVAKDTLHPFIVHTPHGSVEVVGTRFNVSTYEKGQTTVTLEEGVVKVYHENSSGRMQQESLLPGEQAEILSETIRTQTVQVEEYTSWANGIYEYSDTPLETIVQQLSRWYDVNMTFIDARLRSRKFAGVIFRNQPLQKAVETLSKVSDVQFRQNGNVIEIMEKRL